MSWLWGFPGVQMVKHLPAIQEPGFEPWVGKIPWRREWQPIPIFLPGEFHGQRSLAGYSPGGRQESDTNKGLTHTIMTWHEGSTYCWESNLPNLASQVFRDVLDLLSLETGLEILKNLSVGLPGWSSDQESACQWEGHEFEPWSGKMLRGNWARAPQVLSPHGVRRSHRHSKPEHGS